MDKEIIDCIQEYFDNNTKLLDTISQRLDNLANWIQALETKIEKMEKEHAYQNTPNNN